MSVLLNRVLREDCRCSWCYDVDVVCPDCNEVLAVLHSASALTEVFIAHECEGL